MDNATAETMLCFDCKTEVSDYVKERRQCGEITQGMPLIETITVCANRRVCRDNRERKRAEELSDRTCRICNKRLKFRLVEQDAALRAHLVEAHTADEIVAAIEPFRWFDCELFAGTLTYQR